MRVGWSLARGAVKTPLKSTMQLKEREITIQAPWGKLRGLSWGDEGALPVLLCHGKLDVCSGFRPLVKLLPPNFHYVGFDLPSNGRSDHFPGGVLYTAMDLVPAIRAVQLHFRWDKFVFLGHSLGVILGKYYNIAYPSHITRMIELDPVPAHESYPPEPAALRKWYHSYYHAYYEERYQKLNGSGEAPKYSYNKALEMVMQARGLNKEAAECILERSLVPAGGDLYRFTHDQRMKIFSRFPFSGDTHRAIYTSSPTPTFCVLATDSIAGGDYDATPFVKDPESWQHRNYRVKIVEGGHDVHISHPERMAGDVSSFLMEEFQAKL